jgi:hypothetical protein
MWCKKCFSGLIFLCILLSSSFVYGSVVLDPTCFVELEALEDSNARNTSEGVDFRIKALLSGSFEGVGISLGEVYRMHVPQNCVFQKGTIVRAGAVRGGSLGADGKVHPWIHWEPLQDDSGKPLRDSRGTPVVSLSSGVEPVSSNEALSRR